MMHEILAVLLLSYPSTVFLLLALVSLCSFFCFHNSDDEAVDVPEPKCIETLSAKEPDNYTPMCVLRSLVYSSCCTCVRLVVAKAVFSGGDAIDDVLRCGMALHLGKCLRPDASLLDPLPDRFE